MANPKVEEFAAALKSSGKLYLRTENSIVSGNSVFSAIPNIDDEKIEVFRIEVPKQLAVEEFQCFLTFISVMFLDAVIVKLRNPLMDLFQQGKRSSWTLDYEGHKRLLRMFADGENLVMTLGPIPETSSRINRTSQG